MPQHTGGGRAYWRGYVGLNPVSLGNEPTVRVARRGLLGCDLLIGHSLSGWVGAAVRKGEQAVLRSIRTTQPKDVSGERLG